MELPTTQNGARGDQNGPRTEKDDWPSSVTDQSRDDQSLSVWTIWSNTLTAASVKFGLNLGLLIAWIHVVSIQISHKVHILCICGIVSNPLREVVWEKVTQERMISLLDEFRSNWSRDLLESVTFST